MDWDAFFVSWSIVAMLILSRVQFAGVELSLKIGCNIINSLFFFIGPQGSVLIM